MPGHSAEGRSWGGLPLVVDTSAWARAGRAEVRQPWLEALREGRLRISPLTRVEILQSARGGGEFDLLEERLDSMRAAPLTPSVVRGAEAGMRALAHRSAGSQRLPVVDYMVAAGAQELGAAVLHYDRDYDRLAEVMEFESLWLAPEEPDFDCLLAPRRRPLGQRRRLAFGSTLRAIGSESPSR